MKQQRGNIPITKGRNNSITEEQIITRPTLSRANTKPFSSMSGIWGLLVASSGFHQACVGQHLQLSSITYMGSLLGQLHLVPAAFLNRFYMLLASPTSEAPISAQALSSQIHTVVFQVHLVGKSALIHIAKPHQLFPGWNLKTNCCNIVSLPLVMFTNMAPCG